MAPQARREIRLIEEEGGWSAIDEEFGVASCGDTREVALEMLDEAVALHTGGIGRPVTDEDLEKWGSIPAVVSDVSRVSTAPWF